MALRIAEHAHLTDVGRQRHTNEDAYYDRPPVFAVADGMGGAQAGEVASAMAVEEFIAQRDPDASPEEQLEQIARAANRKIWDVAQVDSRRAGMGTTLTAVIVGDREIAVGHVGDSRLYRHRKGELERLTRDHSLVEEFVRQGRLTPEQAEKHPQRSVITRALGPESDVEVETFTVPARDGDVYLLCSDGLSGMVRDSSMQKILASHDALPDAAKALVEAANDNGGRDNITAVLFRVEDDGTGNGPSPETDSYDTIAGDVMAPSTEEIRRAERESPAAIAEDPVPTAIGSAVRPRAPRASPPSALPSPDLSSRPRRPSRRGRLLARGAVAVVALALILGGGVYILTKSVWFLGTNNQGVITLYRGLPYELPLGVNLYEQRLVSGVPALALAPDRRKRILDHQLRSKKDAVDLIRSLGAAAAR